MSTFFANTIDGNEILARRAYEDEKGVPIRLQDVSKSYGDVLQVGVRNIVTGVPISADGDNLSFSFGNQNPRKYSEILFVIPNGVACRRIVNIQFNGTNLTVENHPSNLVGEKTILLRCFPEEQKALAEVLSDSSLFVANLGETTYQVMLLAEQSAKRLIAYHDDQNFFLTKRTADSFIFSGMNSRSWMSQDNGQPCMSELVLSYRNNDLSDYVWEHNWKPLSPIVEYGTGTVEQVNVILDAGLIPVCKRTTSYGYSLDKMVAYQAMDQSYLFENSVTLTSDGTWNS